MRILRIFFILLITSVFADRGISQSKDPDQKPNKIYLKSSRTVPKYGHLSGQVVKHSFDVIYEVKKYDLFLTDETNRKAGYIQNYERLTVDLKEDMVEVTLTDKQVVRRQYGGFSSPLVDLRLALYELFLGKDYVKKNKDDLIKKSEDRIKRIERLIERQDAISEKKNGKEKAVPKIAKVPPSTKPPVASVVSKSSVSPSVTASPALKEPQTAQAPKVKASEDKGKNNSLQDEALKKPAPKEDLDEKTKKTTNPPKSTPSSLNENNKKFNRATTKIKNSESGSKFYLIVGGTGLQGTNAEIVTTTTSLKFLNLGGRYSNIVTKKGQDGLLANLDYEGRFLLSKATSSKEYSVPLGRKLDGYVGSAILDGTFGYGGTFTFENVMIGTVVPPDDGLTMAAINAILIGPEIKLKRNIFKFQVNIFAGYQMAIFSNSNIKQAEYNVNKLYLDLALLGSGKWGYGAKFEQYGINGTRSFGTSTIKITAISLNIFYQI